MVTVLKTIYPHLDLIQAALIVTDIHSKILYINPSAERLFGYKKREIEGKRIRILFLSEDLSLFLPNIIYLTLYQNGFEGEALLKVKHESKIFVHLNTTRIEEGEGGILFFFQEIQHLKKLERERLEMEHWANLGMMVGEIAHQIRNPITAIGGYAQRLLKTRSPSEEGKPDLQRIFEVVKKLEIFMKRVEEYVMISKPVYRKENIQKLLEETIYSFQKEDIPQGVSVHLQENALGDGKELFVDKQLTQKALIHILKNGIDAVNQTPLSKKDKTIQVSLFADENNIGISISDPGEGISKKNMSQIFSPFYSTRPDKVGLGLTFVKRIVEEQGGTIQVQSHLKKGTTVLVMFPKDRRQVLRQKSILPEGFKEQGLQRRG